MSRNPKSVLHHRIKLGPRFILSRTKALVRHPLFFLLTVLGNGFMLGGAFLLYWVEEGTNPRLQSGLDAVWWAVATVTTVGYGDVSPVTTKGKLLGIILMLFGTALFSAFTALFAAVLLEPEMDVMEEEIHDLEKLMHRSEKPPPG